MWSHEAVCLAEQKKVRLCKRSQRFCQDPNRIKWTLEDFHPLVLSSSILTFTLLQVRDLTSFLLLCIHLTTNISHIKNIFIWSPDSNCGLFLSKLSAFTWCCYWPSNSRSADWQLIFISSSLCFFFGKLNILKCFLGLIVTLKLEASCSAKLTSPGLKFAQMLNYSSSVHAELPAALASSEATAALCFSGISH